MELNFIVWLAAGKSLDELKQALQGRGRVLRQLRISPQTVLVRLTEGDNQTPSQIFQAVGPIVEKFEPDVANIQNFQQPMSISTKPDCFAIQAIPGAWDLLSQLGKDRFGSPTLCVGVIQKDPIDPLDPRLAGTLSDGQARLQLVVDCIDSGDVNGSTAYSAFVRQHLRDFSHAAGVCGIIAATPVGSSQVQGIASNTRQAFLRYQPGGAAAYAELLLWLSGVNNSPPPELGLGLGTLQTPRADIICITVDSVLSLPMIVAEAVEQVTRQGRAGKGTIVVCSAGNDDRQVNWLAAHPRVIGVANSCVTSAGNEQRWEASNFGREIDLCATGQGVESLSLPSITGDLSTQTFGGTSAAAPMVAGAVALMLSANPQLTCDEVLDIICASADKIDSGNPAARWQNEGGTLFSPLYGFGRLNVENAVRKAAGG